LATFVAKTAKQKGLAMSSSSEGAGQVKQLIAAFERSEKRNAQARHCITLMILGVILIHALLIWAVIKDFRHQKLPEFTAAMGVELGRMTPQLRADLTKIAERTYPLYIDACEKMFERDLPEMEKALNDELTALDEHAKERWPDIEAGVADILITAEEVIMDELSDILTPSDVDAIKAGYGAALLAKYDSLLRTHLANHAEIASEIGFNLNAIAESEPGIIPPVDLRATLGIMLELVGSELQQGL